eukprot:GILK01005134.1.p1 GENE.GILK01005134.1~~GILK01005134.1.p1  ORF type:complete len:510 (-),score=88.45 GILK01005134.1:194-1723(-)
MSRRFEAQLRTDPEALQRALVDGLSQYDRKKVGIVTAAVFSRVLESLGLRYGSREVDDIMQYCRVTEDAFVNFKPLSDRVYNVISQRSGERSRADTSLSATSDAQPQGNVKIRDILRERSKEIHDAFVRYDTGRITLNEFRRTLREDIGVPETEEFLRFISTNAASGTMSFSKMIQAIAVSEPAARKQPIPIRPATAAAGARDYTGRSGRDTSGSVTPQSESELRTVLSDIVRSYVQGLMSSPDFREALQTYHVTVTPPLDLLIRNHDAHGGARYQDLIRFVLRDVQEKAYSNASSTHNYPSESMDYATDESRSPHRASRTYGDIITWHEPPSELETEDDVRRARQTGGTSGAPQITPADYAPFSKTVVVNHPANIAHGDIIGWSKGDALPPRALRESSPPKRPSTARAARVYGDIINWQNVDLPAEDVRAERITKKGLGLRNQSTLKIADDEDEALPDSKFSKAQFQRPQTALWYEENGSTRGPSRTRTVIPPFGVDHVPTDHFGRLK